MEKHPGQTRIPSRLILLAIVMAAFILRVLMVLTRPMIQLDETIYARMAENLINGLGFVDLTGVPTAHFSPLFPTIIAAVSLVLRDYVISGYAVVVFFGSLILIPTYLLGKALINVRVGLMAAALLAVIPLFVDYSSRLYGESVYVFFLMFFLYFSWQMLKRYQLRYGMLAGASLGIAYLTNPSAVFYFVTLVVLAAAVAVRQSAKRKMVKPLALFLVGFSIFAMPYLMFLHDTTGKWTYTGKEAYEQVFAASRNLRYGSLEWERQAGALTEDGRESWVERSQNTEDLITFFINNPKQAVKIFATQSNVLYTEQLAKVIPLWLLMLIGLGLFSRDWDRRRAAAVGYLFLMMSPVLIILAMYATDRFFMPFLPLAMILTATGWQRLEHWGKETAALSLSQAKQGFWQRMTPWMIGIAVIGPVMFFAVTGVLKTTYDIQFREAGEWIQAEAGPGKNIMARWESTSSYYSGGISVTLPYADYSHFTDYARSKDVDYLVLDRQSIYNFRPDLVMLFAEESSHPEWKLVHTIRPGTSQETMIFQLVR